MIICFSRKFIFIHLHKCAGTSITNALKDILTAGDLLISGGQLGTGGNANQSQEFGQLRKHSTAAEAKDAVGEEIWNSFFKFALVRHPLERIVSFYEFLNRVRQNQSGDTGVMGKILSPFRKDKSIRNVDQIPWSWPGMRALVNTTNFSEFIRSELLSNEQAMNPQASSLVDQEGELLVDYVGKVENVDSDWQAICKRLGMEAPVLNIDNKSRRNFDSLKEYWTPDDIQYIMQKHRIDFELFGYQIPESIE